MHLKFKSTFSQAPSTTAAKANDDDEDIDLFGSDDDEHDEEKDRLTKERLAAYAAKKSKSKLEFFSGVYVV
jgi:elongation factor 1-beta